MDASFRRRRWLAAPLRIWPSRVPVLLRGRPGLTTRAAPATVPFSVTPCVATEHTPLIRPCHQDTRTLGESNHGPTLPDGRIGGNQSRNYLGDFEPCLGRHPEPPPIEEPTVGRGSRSEVPVPQIRHGPNSGARERPARLEAPASHPLDPQAPNQPAHSLVPSQLALGPQRRMGSVDSNGSCRSRSRPSPSCPWVSRPAELAPKACGAASRITLSRRDPALGTCPPAATCPDPP